MSSKELRRSPRLAAKKQTTVEEVKVEEKVEEVKPVPSQAKKEPWNPPIQPIRLVSASQYARSRYTLPDKFYRVELPSFWYPSTLKANQTEEKK